MDSNKKPSNLSKLKRMTELHYSFLAGSLLMSPFSIAQGFPAAEGKTNLSPLQSLHTMKILNSQMQKKDEKEIFTNWNNSFSSYIFEVISSEAFAESPDGSMGGSAVGVSGISGTNGGGTGGPGTNGGPALGGNGENVVSADAIATVEDTNAPTADIVITALAITGKGGDGGNADGGHGGSGGFGLQIISNNSNLLISTSGGTGANGGEATGGNGGSSDQAMATTSSNNNVGSTLTQSSTSFGGTGGLGGIGSGGNGGSGGLGLKVFESILNILNTVSGGAGGSGAIGTGGSGGDAGNASSTATATGSSYSESNISSTANGGNGGNGGNGLGGKGGNGGIGLTASTSVLNNSSTIQGGTGGIAGDGFGGQAGQGNNANASIEVGDVSGTVNTVNVTGGFGGAGGFGIGGTGGHGGLGIDMSRSVLTNSNLISGGAGSNGGAGTGGAGGNGGAANSAATVSQSSIYILDSTVHLNANGGTGGAGGLGQGGIAGSGGIGVSLSASVLSNLGAIAGGSGGNGGNGIGGQGGDGGSTSLEESGASELTASFSNGFGGNGGNGIGGAGGHGGHGVNMTLSTLFNLGTINGGDGGEGGNGTGGIGGAGGVFSGNGSSAPGGIEGASIGGNGGSGGSGIHIQSGALIYNQGVIQGGHGGTAGSGINALSGAGGTGVSGSNVYLINDGFISGGLNGTDTVRANAVEFSGGINTLELHANSAFLGNVVANGNSAVETLALGGTESHSFNVNDIGTQFQNFDIYVKKDNSTWTLTGATNELTPWSILGGILSISNDAQLGNVLGTLTFNGYGGILQTKIDSVTMNRAVFLNSNGIFDTVSDLTIQGAIFGTGDLLKEGAGSLTLAGVNTYSGATDIITGTLFMAATGNVSSSSGIHLLGNSAVFDISEGDQVIRDLSGVAGSQVNVGSQELTFGTNRSTAFAGTFLGNGALVKQGSGSFTLSGDSSGFSGNFLIDSGDVVVNGLLGGDVVVDAAGRLKGTGHVGNTLVYGRIAPGNSIGTLGMASYVAASGSIYEVEINPQGQSDLIAVDTTATLESGAAVAVSKEPGVYNIGTRYTIVTAASGVSGTYSALYQDMPFLNFVLDYDANNVYLTVLRNFIAFNSVAATPNQFAVASGVESLGMGNGLFNAFASLGDTQTIRTALDDLSGEIYASSLGALVEESRYLRDALFTYMDGDLINQNQIINERGVNIWTHGFGGWGNLNGNGNASTLDRNTGGLFLGGDTYVGENARLGLVGGYTVSDFDVDNRHSHMDVSTYHLGIYGNTHLGDFSLNAGAAYSWHDLESNRMISFPYFSNQLTGDYNARTGQVFGELGYNLGLFGYHLKPLVNLAYIHTQADSFEEQGGAAALKSFDSSEDVFYTTLGAREKGLLFQTKNYNLNQRVFLGWRHAYNDLTPDTLYAFASGSQSFLISGTPLARDSFLIDAGFAARQLNKDVSLTVSYIGQFAKQVQDNGITARLALHFS